MGLDRVHFPWRPLGTLLVERGFLTATQLDVALAEQRRTGRLLGQILVSFGYLTGLSLARALSEQHGIELRPKNDVGAYAAPDRGDRSDGHDEPMPDDRDDTPEARAWQPLGKLLVEKGLLLEAELETALAEQRERRGRLGEILVARGFLSGTTLARVLAEQHGVDLGTLSDLDAHLQAVIKPGTTDDPCYRVYEVIFERGYQARTALYDSTNFLEAADFACEHVQDHDPAAVEIERTQGDSRETIWTYSESRASAAAESRERLVDTFGFDPTSWGR
jgi:hypothetical protein